MGRPQSTTDTSVYHIPLSAESALTDDIIMDLHAMFLTKGIHQVKVCNQKYGRQLVDTLLTSLNYYQNIGFLTLDHITENALYQNVFGLLHECGYLDEHGNHNFDLFLQEAFFFDFMVIEVTDELKNEAWFFELIKAIKQLSFDMQLPIICINY